MTKPDAPASATAAATPARRGRPSKKQAAGTGDTRASILDAAEDLFSKHGFYGVTIREVAREAGVDTALVHYYFGAKRALFDAVFLRRAEVWNSDRVNAINRYAEAAGADMTLEGLLAAFLHSPFEWALKGGPGWKHYAALVAQTNANPAFGGETMARYFDPAIHRLIELIARVLPEASEVERLWADSSLMRSLTGWTPEYGEGEGFRRGLRETIDWFSEPANLARYKTDRYIL